LRLAANPYYFGDKTMDFTITLFIYATESGFWGITDETGIEMWEADTVEEAIELVKEGGDNYRYELRG
jgi:hypothetical protein